ncbi:MAG: hypothetical protein HQK62_00150 [Desulfamplus sp.]|nr:hypothetical protein [Desulfamplus sp.]
MEQFKKGGCVWKSSLQMLILAIMLCCFTSISHAAPETYSSWTKDLSEDADPEKLYRHEYPKVVVSEDYVHVVWRAYKKDYSGHSKLLYRRSIDGGETFEEPVTLISQEKDIYFNAEYNNVVADGQYLHIFYTYGWPSQLIYLRSGNYGQTFDDPVTFSSEYHSYSGIYITAESSKVAVAWSTNNNNGHNNIYCSYSDDGGENFTTTTVTHDDDSSKPSIYQYSVVDAIRSGDYIYILSVTQDQNYYTSQNHLYLWASTDGGKSFKSPQKVNLPDANKGYYTRKLQDVDYSPNMATSGKEIIITWLNVDNPGGFDGWQAVTLRTRRSLDAGTTLENPTTLHTFPSGYHSGANAGLETITRNGNSVYVTTVVSNDPPGTYVWSSQDGGATWEEPVRLSAGGWWPHINVDDSHVNVVNSWFYQSDDAGKTFNGGVNPQYNFNNWYSPTMVTDKNGAVHYVGSSATHSNSYDNVILYRKIGSQPLPGAENKAVQLIKLEGDRRRDNIQVPAGADLNFTNAMTAEIWVKRNSDEDSYYATLLRKKKLSGDGSYVLGAWNDFQIYSRIVTDNSTNKNSGEWLGTESTLEKGIWTHLAMTYDADVSADNWKIYVNGILAAKATIKGKILTDTMDSPLVIGYDGTSYTGDCIVDEVRLWNRALSEIEIKNQMNTPLSGTESGLKVYLNFDDTFKDITQRGNDGIPMYMESFVESDIPKSEDISQDVALTIDESNIDDFYPAHEFNSNFLTHSYNPFGAGDNIFESCSLKVGDGGVRIENLLMDVKAYWLDLILNINNPSLPLEIQNIGTGSPPAHSPEWDANLPVIDFKLSTADVFGPPFQITLFNVGIADKSYDLDFIFDGATGLFNLADFRESGYLHYLNSGSNNWLGVITKSAVSPSFNLSDGISMNNVDFGDRIGFSWSDSGVQDYLSIDYGDRTDIQSFKFNFNTAVGSYLHPDSFFRYSARYSGAYRRLSEKSGAKISNSLASSLLDFSLLGKKLTTSESLDQCIENQTLINVELAADNDLQSALYDLTFAIFDKLKIYDSKDQEAFTAVKSFISDSKDSIADMISNGQVNPETLTVLIGTTIVKNATPEQHQKIIKAVWGDDPEKNMPGYIQSLAAASGDTAEKQYKQALLAFTKGAVSTAFPLLSASAKTIIEAKKWAIDIMSNKEIQESYRAFKNIGGGDWDFFDQVNSKINPNIRMKIKNILKNQGKSETDANINEYLKNTFNNWYQKETQEMSKIKESLQSLKDEYMKDYYDFDSAMKKLLGEDASECEKFAKFVELTGKFTMDLKSSMGKCKYGKPSSDDIKNQAVFMVKNYFISSSSATNRTNYQKNKLTFLKARDCFNYEKKQSGDNTSTDISLTDQQKKDFLDCACRCSSGWAGHIGVWYDPNPASTTENGGEGPCIGGVGSYGGSRRHQLIVNDCTKSCWPSNVGTYNSTAVEKFLKQENENFGK